jgi:transcriptional regulator with XRE-family HTH domain
MTSEDKPTQRLRAGEWLRTQREQRGFSSAAELGRAIGTTKEVIWSYEKGRASVPDERAAQIAEALGMDLIEVRRNLGLWVPVEGKASADPGELTATARPEGVSVWDAIRDELDADAAEAAGLSVDDYRLEERVARQTRMMREEGDLEAAVELDYWLKSREQRKAQDEREAG